ncbi:ecotropic viral integration site 5 ortholog isoform X2 [Boleophthalmus pectinirostris]|uniref:ecotropic viral integration site 5 ortholog isoform X2 n=1 Tax=Boleophthalmus pectinirostris TaxID=150288 RepID=UPI00242B57E4|nr:ecotropic viral integration site 5 ortholog isoform X2 [Boleophthalmus pectinirostris]
MVLLRKRKFVSPTGRIQSFTRGYGKVLLLFYFRNNMLNTLRLEQKNPSDGDSSDSGSELGLEPETDRFGFLLTDGSTDSVRTVGPSPVLVRQREAKWINIIDQWDRLLLKKTSKIKVQCHKGIPASLRAKCWPLLSGASDQMKKHKDLYTLLDSQPALTQWEDVIERDLDRQFPFHEMFVAKDGHGQRSLFQVLKAYTQFKPEEGYCQAQGPVAAVLLMNMPAEEAFWCLVQICEQYLPGYYSPLLEGVLFDAAILMWVLKKSCPAAHKHLQYHGVEPLMFATDWLMCLFTRHLPFNTLLRVWDLFFCYGVRVLLQVAVVLVQRVLGREDQRKQCCGQMETLQKLRGIREEVKDEEDDFIFEVLSVSLSAKDLQKRTEKEIQKWRKERPSSTFDPRDRCLGYHMAWLRSRQSTEECERRDREKGNLSVPLFRSASSLSLSPSKWQKGVKAKSGVKLMRHLSMGAKEDCRSLANLNVKKVQSLQDNGFDLIEKKKQSDPGQEHQIQQNELLEESEIQQIQNVPQITIKDQTEQINEKVVIKSAADSPEQEENVDPKLPQIDDITNQQKEKQSTTSKEPSQNPDATNTEEDDSNKDSVVETYLIVNTITTNTDVQPSVQINETIQTEVDNGQEKIRVSVNHVKSLKQLATEATRRSESKNETKDSGEKVSLAGQFYLTESLPGTEIKSHNQAEVEIYELAAQEPITDAASSGNDAPNMDAKHLQKQMEKTQGEIFTQSCRNGIQAIRQDISAKLEVSEAQILVDSQSIPITCDGIEEATYFNMLPQTQQCSSSEPSGENLSTDADTSTQNFKHCTPEKEKQSNVYNLDKELQTRKESNDIHQLECEFMNTNQQYNFRSSGDFRVRKSSSSRGSRFARRLSADLFTTPQLVEQKVINNMDHIETNETIQMSRNPETEATTHKEHPPKRFGLFRRLREEKKNKKQSKPKLQVPKILIQDFSDVREIGQVTEVESKLTSRERRRQRREQKRKEKDDEKEKNKEELEKESRRGQDKSTSVHAQSEKDKLQLRDAVSQSRNETSYADVYF